MLQKRAIRHITKVDYRDHTSKLFLNNNLLKLADLIKLNLLSIVHRALNNLLPQGVNNLFIPNNTLHNYNTRQASNLHCYPCHSNLLANSVYNRAINFWNSLGNEFKSIKSYHLFRKKVKHEMFQSY